ncbi:hypothetical protein [Sphingosinicella sp. BN140058]|uniref:hypothetical protein n=1 Tax=Sphingosinicella sp. BN140058 TaxID=1892855 RepID=UPI0010121B06|nr:hypothetical protein [Sphingosinicella sp. BN140058]QAY75998.1 hypothetical protein ETR14_05245 [Sphingosinicella sp. BN140058]
MSFILALTLSAMADVPAIPVTEHRTRLDHSGRSLEIHYRGQVSLVTRQIGSVTKAGTPSTLRCLWRADIDLRREAQSGAGVRLARGIDREGVLEGSRSGWCDAHRTSIAREVAGRADQIQAQVRALAQEDHDMLKSEFERTTGNRDG